MPAIAPIKRRDLIAYLRQLGFRGPISRGRHQLMRDNGRTFLLPNPHRSDIGREYLIRLLRQAGISKDEWERL